MTSYEKYDYPLTMGYYFSKRLYGSRNDPPLQTVDDSPHTVLIAQKQLFPSRRWLLSYLWQMVYGMLLLLKKYQVTFIFPLHFFILYSVAHVILPHYTLMTSCFYVGNYHWQIFNDIILLCKSKSSILYDNIEPIGKDSTLAFIAVEVAREC